MHPNQSLNFQPPPGFIAEEMMLSWRLPPDKALSEPRVLNRQVPPAASLIVHVRPSCGAPTTEAVTGQLLAELIQSVPGLESPETSRFVFSDGTEGAMLIFEFTAGSHVRLKQRHVVRLDGETATVATLTIPAETSTEKEGEYLRAIGTIAPRGDR